MEQSLVKSIREQTDVIFYNMEVSMKACPRDTLICGVPAWRYVYHTLHSCDKWFSNPARFSEPSVHTENLDKVDLPTGTVLIDETLWNYFSDVRERVMNYLSELSDADLYDKPDGCDFTRLELVLGQFRHFMAHIGIFNGITIERTGKYPMVAGLEKWKEGRLDGPLYDEPK